MTTFQQFKPPLGIAPRWFWLENLEIPYFHSKEEKANRITKLKGVIDRYNNWEYLTMKYYRLIEEWEQELKDLEK